MKRLSMTEANLASRYLRSWSLCNNVQPIHYVKYAQARHNCFKNFCELITVIKTHCLCLLTSLFGFSLFDVKLTAPTQDDE